MYNLNNNIHRVEENGDWGGPWTADKIEIFIKYLKAYLDIMKKNDYFELIYFDGFAGSGEIKTNQKYGLTLGSIALRVATFEHQHQFDIYYLVDKSQQKIKRLEEKIKNDAIGTQRNIYCVAEDANTKINSLTTYMRQASAKRKALMLIDPYGLQINWESMEACKGLGIDMWVLVPTGVGVNRLLVKNGNIDEVWLERLSLFLGMTQEEIKAFFYTKKQSHTLFGTEEQVLKEADAVHKIAELYRDRLKNIWQYISEPFPMKVPNTQNILYHFIFATNNKSGLKIANDIIGKFLI